jgi:hypothetical protein
MKNCYSGQLAPTDKELVYSPPKDIKLFTCVLCGEDYPYSSEKPTKPTTCVSCLLDIVEDVQRNETY